MNFCTKCASYYQTAGTCNCYAAAQPYRIQPWTPTPWTNPPYPWWNPTTNTVTNPSGTNYTTPNYQITNNTGAVPFTYTSGYSAPVT